MVAALKFAMASRSQWGEAAKRYGNYTGPLTWSGASNWDPGTSNGVITLTAASTNTTATPLYTWPATTDAQAVGQAVWATWNNIRYDQVISQWNVIAHETQEQRAERAQQLAQYEQEQRVRIDAQRAEHQRANARAEALLTEHLTPMQREDLRARGCFHLETIAASGERRRYRIRRGRHGNIDQVDPHGKVIKSLCVHPTMQLPDADTMLAQKLWLEHNEPELLRVANHIPMRAAR